MTTRKIERSGHPSEHIAGSKGQGFLLMRLVTLSLLVIGIIFRLRQYLANRSLWLDEAMLSLNIIHRTFGQLWQPLDYGQGAPVGFLMLQKWAANSLGTSEFALRLVPLLAGILSVLLFHKLAKSTITPEGVPLALALFAFSPSLICYSSEVKQYSSDVTIALLLMYLAIEAAGSDWRLGRMIAFSVAGTVAVWLSHPSVFVLAGASTVVLGILIARRDWRKLWSASAILLMWVGSFAICYFILLRKLSQSSFLLAYWRLNFMPFPPRSVADLKWFEDSFFGFFTSSAALRFSGLAALAFVLGCLSMLKRNRGLLLLLVSPAMATLVASGMHKYPFWGRLNLFLVPMALLLMTEGAVAVYQTVGNRLPPAGVVLLGLLLVDPGLYTLHRFAAPLTANDRAGVMPLEDLKPVMQYLQTHLEPGDTVYVYHWAQPAFEYYAERTNFPREHVAIGTASGNDVLDYESELKRFSGRRMWVVFSHVEGMDAVEPIYVKICLELTGPRIESFARPGAEADLYDLGAAGRSAAIPQASHTR